MGGRASDVVGYSGASGPPAPPQCFLIETRCACDSEETGYHPLFFLRDQWSAAGHLPHTQNRPQCNLGGGGKGGAGPGMAQNLP